MYPSMTAKEREDAITKEHKAVFIMKIGGKLASGKKHDGRSPDYDDWELNGDIILWNDVLDRAFEISSMGIRVDKDAMAKQLKAEGCEERAELEKQFNQQVKEQLSQQVQEIQEEEIKSSIGKHREFSERINESCTMEPGKTENTAEETSIDKEVEGQSVGASEEVR